MSNHATAATVPPTPSDQRARVLARATASITEHGASPGQAAAMAEISRIRTESNDPAAAGQVLARIAAEKSQQRCTVETAGGNSPSRPARPVRFADPVRNAEYWARIAAITATAPPLSDEQKIVIRLAFNSVYQRMREAA